MEGIVINRKKKKVLFEQERKKGEVMEKEVKMEEKRPEEKMSKDQSMR